MHKCNRFFKILKIIKIFQFFFKNSSRIILYMGKLIESKNRSNYCDDLKVVFYIFILISPQKT